MLRNVCHLGRAELSAACMQLIEAARPCQHGLTAVCWYQVQAALTLHNQLSPTPACSLHQAHFKLQRCQDRFAAELGLTALKASAPAAPNTAGTAAAATGPGLVAAAIAAEAQEALAAAGEVPVPGVRELTSESGARQWSPPGCWRWLGRADLVWHGGGVAPAGVCLYCSAAQASPARLHPNLLEDPLCCLLSHLVAEGEDMDEDSDEEEFADDGAGVPESAIVTVSDVLEDSRAM